MIYADCAVCGESVYRYSPDNPKPGQMGNATQDCWHLMAQPSAGCHLPTWPAGLKLDTVADVDRADAYLKALTS